MRLRSLAQSIAIAVKQCCFVQDDIVYGHFTIELMN
jgi:hypothetical protein